MIEKVARAIGGICNEKGQELASKCGAQAPPIPWQAFKREAKAAIEAMREPTDEMANKGENALAFAKNLEPDRDVPSGTWWAAILCFRHMIDAALSRTLDAKDQIESNK